MHASLSNGRQLMAAEEEPPDWDETDPVAADTLDTLGTLDTLDPLTSSV